MTGARLADDLDPTDWDAAPPLTRIDGRPAIRAAVVNHRTDARDVEALVREAPRLGRELSAAS